MGLTKLAEDLLNRFAGSRCDQVIQIQEILLKMKGESSADRCLTGTHESDKKNEGVIRHHVFPARVHREPSPKRRNLLVCGLSRTYSARRTA